MYCRFEGRKRRERERGAMWFFSICANFAVGIEDLTDE